jgi:hypothetical protein
MPLNTENTATVHIANLTELNSLFDINYTRVVNSMPNCSVTYEKLLV